MGDSVNDKWMNFLTENIIMDIANLGNIIVTPLRKVMQISKENLEMDLNTFETCSIFFDVVLYGKRVRKWNAASFLALVL